MKNQTWCSKSLIYWSMFYSYAPSRKLKRRLSPQFPAVYVIELSLSLLLCCSKKYLNIDIYVLIISLTGSFILIAQLFPRLLNFQYYLTLWLSGCFKREHPVSKSFRFILCKIRKEGERAKGRDNI